MKMLLSRENKKAIFFVLPIVISIVFFISPALAQTQITISTGTPGNYGPTAGTAGPGALVANFYQFALMIGGVLAFGVVVYGGVKYMASAGNPSGQSDAKEWIGSALLGLLLLVGVYLILSVINPQLLNLNLPSLTPVNISSITPAGGGGTSSGGSGVSGSPLGGSATPASIAAAAAAAQASSMSSANGPGGGTVACAWAVNQVLASTGVAPLDTNSVQSMENALTAGRGTLVDPSQAVAGDIVIQAQDGHVGICMNNGCTQVISNSSSHATFTWVSNTSFSPSYNGGPGRIYQVNQ
jgi:hypothetical protein